MSGNPILTSARLRALSFLVFLAVLAGCAPEGTSVPAAAPVRSERPILAQVRLGDPLAMIQSLTPKPDCHPDEEAEPNDPDEPLVCELTGVYGGRSITFSAMVANGRAWSVQNRDLAAEDVAAVSAAIRTTLGEPSAVEKSGSVQRETWTIGSETVVVALDSAYGGGSVVLKGDAPATAAATTSAATSGSDCEGARLVVKGLCIGMPIDQAVARVAAFSKDVLSERRVPGQSLTLHENTIGSIVLRSQGGHLVGFFIGGPAAESAFRAGDMSIDAFAQAIIDNYDVPRLDVDSVTEEPFGRETLRTVTYIHRFDEGVEVKVRGNNAGAKSLEVVAATPAAERTFD